jgi:hypothetical protein
VRQSKTVNTPHSFEKLSLDAERSDSINSSFRKGRTPKVHLARLRLSCRGGVLRYW